MFGTVERLGAKRRAVDALEAEWLVEVAEYDRSHDWTLDPGRVPDGPRCREPLRRPRPQTRQASTGLRRVPRRRHLPTSRPSTRQRPNAATGPTRTTSTPALCTCRNHCTAVTTCAAPSTHSPDRSPPPQSTPRGDATSNPATPVAPPPAASTRSRTSAAGHGELGESHGVRPHLSGIVMLDDLDQVTADHTIKVGAELRPALPTPRLHPPPKRLSSPPHLVVDPRPPTSNTFNSPAGTTTAKPTPNKPEPAPEPAAEPAADNRKPHAQRPRVGAPGRTS